MSWDRSGVRAFGLVTYGGPVFESCYLIYNGSIPRLSDFYSDKSYLRGWSHHHMIDHKFIYVNTVYILHIRCILHIMHIHSIVYIWRRASFTASLFNINEDVRAKLSSWSVIAWMPFIDTKKLCADPKAVTLIPPEICDAYLLCAYSKTFSWYMT